MIRFFFEYKNQVIQLPVNPAEIIVSSAGSNKTTEIVELGEVNILRRKRLSEYTVQCFLPATADNPYVLTTGQFSAPKFYIDFFEQIRADRLPCRFIISDTDINTLVSIEKFEYGLKAQDDDTHYSLTLKEYRTYAAKQIQVNSDQNTGTVVSTTQPKTGFAIGDVVVVTGKGWYNSYGAKPSVTATAFTGKISHIVADKSRPYRFHLQRLTGGNVGWFAESALKHKA